VFRNLVSNWERADKRTRARFAEHAGFVERMPRVSAIAKAGPRS
jgi:hypothetical protein